MILGHGAPGVVLVVGAGFLHGFEGRRVGFGAGPAEAWARGFDVGRVEGVAFDGGLGGVGDV